MTCVFIWFMCDIMHFVLWICTNKFAFELFLHLRYLLLICVNKAGRSSLLHQIERSYRFLPSIKFRQRKNSYGRQQ